jgi:site-specific recombinase XerD
VLCHESAGTSPFVPHPFVTISPCSCRMRHKQRTCARLCHQAGGELEQIQFLLGHVSIQTTERYLGCKQRFRNAVNDHIGLEPEAPS